LNKKLLLSTPRGGCCRLFYIVLFANTIQIYQHKSLHKKSKFAALRLKKTRNKAKKHRRKAEFNRKKNLPFCLQNIDY